MLPTQPLKALSLSLSSPLSSASPFRPHLLPLTDPVRSFYLSVSLFSTDRLRPSLCSLSVARRTYRTLLQNVVFGLFRRPLYKWERENGRVAWPAFSDSRNRIVYRKQSIWVERGRTEKGGEREREGERPFRYTAALYVLSK